MKNPAHDQAAWHLPNRKFKIEPMQPEKRAKLDLRIKGANNIHVTADYIHPAYRTPDAKTSSITTLTDRLELFRVEPVEKTLPTFCGRWDREEEEVDIDIVGVSPEEETLFRSERNGYKGHHTQRTVGPPRRFQIDISIPQLHVFRGNIVLNLTFEKRVEGQLSPV